MKAIAEAVVTLCFLSSLVPLNEQSMVLRLSYLPMLFSD